MKRLRAWIYGIYRWSIGRPWHCWADHRDWLEAHSGYLGEEWVATYVDGNSTCFRLHGHFGSHRWTRDDQITVKFPSTNP